MRKLKCVCAVRGTYMRSGATQVDGRFAVMSLLKSLCRGGSDLVVARAGRAEAAAAADPQEMCDRPMARRASRSQ